MGGCGVAGGVLIGWWIWVDDVIIGWEWGVEPGGVTFGCVYAEGKRLLVQDVWGESRSVVSKLLAVISRSRLTAFSSSSVAFIGR